MEALVNRPKRRYALGIGVAALVAAGAAWWWWRRRQSTEIGSFEDEGEGGGIGAFLPAWITGGRRQDSAWDTGRASKAQIDRAAARVPLSDPRQAEDRSLFTTGARASAGPAYFHTAYWLAVGSRLLGGDSELDALARRHQGYGSQWALVPGASLRPGNVGDIYRAAHSALQSRAGNNRAVASVAAQVRFGPADVESAVTRDADTNPLKMAPALVRQNISDTVGAGVSAAEIAAGILTGRQPTGMGGWTWFGIKWGARIAIGALVLLGVRVYFAPQYHAAKAALAPAARAAGQLGQRATAFAGDLRDRAIERNARAEREELREGLRDAGLRNVRVVGP